MPAVAKNRTSFAARLLNLRKLRGLTQEELSDLSGVSRRVIAHHETNIKAPTADVVMRLAKALDVSPDQMMGRRPVKLKQEISRQTIKRAKMLEELPDEAKDSVMKMIDAWHHQTAKTKPS